MHDPALRSIRAVVRSSGMRVFLVGGPLRDAFLGQAAGDIDLAVEGSPRRLGLLLRKRLDGELVLHREFGTGTLVLPGGAHIDLARTRRESYVRPAALPLVSPAGIRTDLARRDFTMAWDMASGELIDVSEGEQDLRNRVIRVLHDRSFLDDPTRIFRAIRLSVRLGFSIEPVTSKLMDAAIAEGAVGLLSGKRVLAELERIVSEAGAPAMLRELNRRQVFAARFGQALPARALGKIARLPVNEPRLRLIYLVSLLPSAHALPLSRADRDDVARLRAWPGLQARVTAARKPSETRRLLDGWSRDALRALSLLEAKPMAHKILLLLNRLASAEPLVSGRDLKVLGLTPGPIYGRLRDRLRDRRLDQGALTRNEELALVREWIDQGKYEVRSAKYERRSTNDEVRVPSCHGECREGKQSTRRFSVTSIAHVCVSAVRGLPNSSLS